MKDIKTACDACTKAKCDVCIDHDEFELDNPFCGNCREKDCLVSMDGTCAMVRKYLEATK